MMLSLSTLLKKYAKFTALLSTLISPALVFAAHPVDQLYLSLIKKGQIQKATPETVLRRMSLHLRGVTPSAAEVRAYQKADPATRRAIYAQKFLKSREFAEYWGQILGSLFREQTKHRSGPYAGFYRYLSDSLHQNKPYRQLITEMITAKGDVKTNPAGWFYLRDDGDPLQVASFLSRSVYGQDLSCARCHDHPKIKDFSRRDFYAMSAFFSQSWVQKRYTTEFLPRERKEHLPLKYQQVYKQKERDWQRNVFGKMNKHQQKRWREKNKLKNAIIAFEEKLGLRFPYTDNAPGGDMVDPLYPDGTEPEIYGDEDRRVFFARWLTSDENPRFHKTIINRIWYQLTGWAFYENFENIDPDAKIEGKELLSLLEKTFKDNDTRLKNIIYYIVTSDAYARAPASQHNPADKKDGVLAYSEYHPRRLNYSQLFNSLLAAAHIEKAPNYSERDFIMIDGILANLNQKDFIGEGKTRHPQEKQREYSAACEIEMPARETTFIAVFGAGDRIDINDDSDDITIDQILTLMNGRLSQKIYRTAAGKKSYYQELFQKTKEMKPVFEELFFDTLGRAPDKDEAKLIERLSQNRLARQKNEFQKHLFEDLTWAIINSDEFLHVY